MKAMKQKCAPVQVNGSFFVLFRVVASVIAAVLVRTTYTLVKVAAQGAREPSASRPHVLGMVPVNILVIRTGGAAVLTKNCPREGYTDTFCQDELWQ